MKFYEVEELNSIRIKANKELTSFKLSMHNILRDTFGIWMLKLYRYIEINDWNML